MPIDDYDVEIEVKGLQPAKYHVEVRKGIARKALRNGRPLRQRRTLGTWSINGMFSTMASDVEHLRRSEQGREQSDTLHLELRAEFDSQWGYPLRYHRLEQVRFGNNRSVSWQVTKFKVTETDSDNLSDGTIAPDDEDETCQAQPRPDESSTQRRTTHCLPIVSRAVLETITS